MSTEPETSQPAPAPAQKLLEFAGPMLDLLGDNPKIDQVKEWIGISVGIWNAVTVEEWDKEEGAVKVARGHILGEHPELLEVFDRLVARKREEFSDQEWGISKYDLSRNDDGEFKLALEVRLRAPFGKDDAAED